MGKLTLLSYEAYNVAPKQPPVRFLPGLTVCSLNPLRVSHRLWPPGSLISRAAGRCNWVWRNSARGPTGRTVGLYTAWSLDHHAVSCCCCSDTRRLQRLPSHSTELMGYRPTYGMADECYSLRKPRRDTMSRPVNLFIPTRYEKWHLIMPLLGFRTGMTAAASQHTTTTAAVRQ